MAPEDLTESVNMTDRCIYTVCMPLNKFLDVSHQGPDVDKCTYMVAACVCLNLRKMSRIITQMYDEALKPSGLRSTQLPVLVTLVSVGSMTVNDLADDLVMDRTSLSRLLRPLVARGLVKMTPGEDRALGSCLSRPGKRGCCNCDSHVGQCAGRGIGAARPRPLAGPQGQPFGICGIEQIVSWSVPAYNYGRIRQSHDRVGVPLDYLPV